MTYPQPFPGPGGSGPSRLKTRGGVGWGKFTPRSIVVTTPANENNGSIVWL